MPARRLLQQRQYTRDGLLSVRSSLSCPFLGRSPASCRFAVFGIALALFRLIALRSACLSRRPVSKTVFSVFGGRAKVGSLMARAACRATAGIIISIRRTSGAGGGCVARPEVDASRSVSPNGSG